MGLGADLIEAHGVQERLLLRVCEPVRQAVSVRPNQRHAAGHSLTRGPTLPGLVDSAPFLFYIGSGDPKKMPVLRAELIRSVYRRYFTPSGRLFGSVAGARDLTEGSHEMIKRLNAKIYAEAKRLKVKWAGRFSRGPEDSAEEA